MLVPLEMQVGSIVPKDWKQADENKREKASALVEKNRKLYNFKTRQPIVDRRLILSYLHLLASSRRFVAFLEEK